MAVSEYSGCVGSMNKRYGRAHYLFSFLTKIGIQFNSCLSFPSSTSQSLACWFAHSIWIFTTALHGREYLHFTLEETDSQTGCLENPQTWVVSALFGGSIDMQLLLLDFPFGGIFCLLYTVVDEGLVLFLKLAVHHTSTTYTLP